MDKLLAFLWRYNYTLFFLLLLSFSFYLVILNNRFQHTSFYTRYYEWGGKYNSLKTNLFNYLHLAKVNESLLQENAYLRSNNLSSLLKRENELVYLGDSVFSQKYSYIPAKVTKSTVVLENNYLILDQGANQGISPGMGVITFSGIVGKVWKVSPNFSSVLSLLSIKNAGVGTIEKTGYQGRLVWSHSLGSERLSLADIAVHAEVSVGDTVSTGNASSLYPQDIPVGVITKVEKTPGEVFCYIELRPFVQFNALKTVYVVNNLFQLEQSSVEAETLESLNKTK